LTEWLDGRLDLKASTRRSYSLIIKTYLAPLLGHIELERLRAADITRMFTTIGQWNSALAAGHPVRKSQHHVGPAAMQRKRAVLRAALNDAVRDGLIPFNPATRVRMVPERKPRPLVWTSERTAAFWAEHARRIETKGQPADAFKIWRDASLRPGPVMVWTPAQSGAFLDYTAGDQLSALYETVATTGMRRAEVCGLRWTDVDLDGPVITVMTTRIAMGSAVHEETPKSEAGRRNIPLDKGTVAPLRAHRARQAADRLAWGDAWAGSGLCLPGRTGRRFTRTR
jgi:integrase